MDFYQKIQDQRNFLIFLLLIARVASYTVYDDYEDQDHAELLVLPRNGFSSSVIKNIDIGFPGCGIRSPLERRKRRQTQIRSDDSRFLGQEELNRTSNVDMRKRRRKIDPNEAPSPRVVGGVDALPYSWPWMVVIFHKFVPGRHLCGASLISQKYVLTAAHCFDGGSLNPSDFLVKVGAHNAVKDGTEYSIEEILIHPKFREGQFYHDIALLKVEGLVELSAVVSPVCLPSDGLKNQIKDGPVYVNVIGWGNTAFGGDNSEVLQEVKLPVVSLKECRASYTRVSARSIPRGVTTGFFCAGYMEGGKDACQGDSGGPISSELADGSWVQVGIVSFGYGCAKPGFPGLYTRISKYTQWIYENTDLGEE